MVRLEEITVGASLFGIAGGAQVNVVAVQWYGNAALEITFKNARGQLANQLLYREDEDKLGACDNSLPRRFDADANLLRLVSEAYRIGLAPIFDPYLAVHTSAIEPLPHQISAVYRKMLSRLPLRYVLADGSGAGKTITAGLLIKELLLRGDMKRCMIVAPGNVAEMWQDELDRKFNLRFVMLTNDRIESSVTGNGFTEENLIIVRPDKLSRNQRILEKLRVTDWDLIVCDDAHKMSATVWGGEVKYTKRFQLGRLLSSITRHFLLLTATPHNGNEEDFQLFMSLIDQDRFGGVTRSGGQAVEVSDVMRRLVKEDLLKFDGTPLFPERRAHTVNYGLSPLEAMLYTAVTDYVRDEFNRAEHLSSEHRKTVGFALTVLQRRLASSPEAIYQSLKRRRERLESRLAEERLGRCAAAYIALGDDDFDEDDLPSAELEDMEEEVVGQASAARTIGELEAEIAALIKLERMAGGVLQSGEDGKWDELANLLRDNHHMFGGGGLREKLIIFTEHRDTLRYLAAKIRSLLGREEAVATIHGSMLRDERRMVEELFMHDKAVYILIATDAACEGINMQLAHLMINYDLSWNPNRPERRFGRIHCIGQTEVCHLWNLVSRETRERLNRTVDHSLNRAELYRLPDARALTEDAMDVCQVMAIREDMERTEAHKLQPHFMEAFFIEAFRNVGGIIRPREKGRYEITSVPFALRNRGVRLGFGEPVLSYYERVCFDKTCRSEQGQASAVLIAPGHPLLETTVDLVRERHGDVLNRGAVFVDDSDCGTETRLLCYVEDCVQDGMILPNGSRRVISRRVHFVEIKAGRSAANAGYAAYLDYRAAHDDEQAVILPFLNSQQWLGKNVEDIAIGYAVRETIPAHVREVKARKINRIDKTAKAVKERLTAEIRYWDLRSADLKRKQTAGKIGARHNSQVASRRAEELAARMQKRLAELEAEKLISAMPPIVVGRAIIVPRGLLNKLLGRPDTFEVQEEAHRGAAAASNQNSP
ncbi:MAG: DEAD/DEAH box helicase [Paenibacillaceae bacterium]|nr:DEAD/DEAH box helicase [Paenibacillaceae bacterium]